MKYLDKLINTNELNYNEILYLLKNITEKELEILRKEAHNLRNKYYEGIYLRGLIEISNYCKCNCKYCGIRRSQTKATRYRLKKEEILKACAAGYQMGLRTFVLQGGEDSFYTDEVLVDIISSIKAKYDVAITISLGERSYQSYERLKNAGADRYLLRHETADNKLYDFLHENMTLESRKECLISLKKLGYQIGAGFMVGLPFQTAEILAKDLYFLKKLDPQMVGIGPFIAHKDTPLARYESGTVSKTILMIILTRLLLPKAMIPATTALATMDEQGRDKALLSGANVVMPNITPKSLRKNYEIYENKNAEENIKQILLKSGFKVDMGKGDYYGW